MGRDRARLDERESGGFERALVELELAGSPGRARALVYVARAGNPNFLGPARLEAIARRCATRAGAAAATSTTCCGWRRRCASSASPTSTYSSWRSASRRARAERRRGRGRAWRMAPGLLGERRHHLLGEQPRRHARVAAEELDHEERCTPSLRWRSMRSITPSGAPQMPCSASARAHVAAVDLAGLLERRARGRRRPRRSRRRTAARASIVVEVAAAARRSGAAAPRPCARAAPGRRPCCSRCRRGARRCPSARARRRRRSGSPGGRAGFGSHSASFTRK